MRCYGLPLFCVYSSTKASPAMFGKLFSYLPSSSSKSQEHCKHSTWGLENNLMHIYVKVIRRAERPRMKLGKIYSSKHTKNSSCIYCFPHLTSRTTYSVCRGQDVLCSPASPIATKMRWAGECITLWGQNLSKFSWMLMEWGTWYSHLFLLCEHPSWDFF